jgi:hypothetical protein
MALRLKQGSPNSRRATESGDNANKPIPAAKIAWNIELPGYSPGFLSINEATLQARFNPPLI